MSPVSRGRKNKKKTKSARRGKVVRPPAGIVQEQFAAPQHPSWFNAATETVLARADVLLGAHTPRQLDEATAVLLGAEMYARLQAGGSLHFDVWFEELIVAASTAVQAGLDSGGDSWRAPYRLLHGLAAMTPADLDGYVDRHLADLSVRAAWSGEGEFPEPDWLAQASEVYATGEVWQLRDLYDGRRAVIAAFTYPEQGERTAYLFDIDVCGHTQLAHAGVYDDEHQAAAAWQALVGDAAHDAVLTPVQASDQLQCLAYSRVADTLVIGLESRAVMDNWFRSRRRLNELAPALRARGMPLPPGRLLRNVDVGPAVEAFTAWFSERYGAEPHPYAAEAVATSWLEGTVPDATCVASPHRAEYQLALMSDWPDDMVTLGARTFLPEWIRWNGERSGLPEPAIEAAVAVASGRRPRAATECPEAP
jgi:hypothetical protein